MSRDNPPREPVKLPEQPQAAQDAMAEGELRYCPECGADFRSDSAFAHAQEHWPDYARGAGFGGLAKERYEAVMAEWKRQGH